MAKQENEPIQEQKYTSIEIPPTESAFPNIKRVRQLTPLDIASFARESGGVIYPRKQLMALDDEEFIWEVAYPHDPRPILSLSLKDATERYSTSHMIPHPLGTTRISLENAAIVMRKHHVKIVVPDSMEEESGTRVFTLFRGGIQAGYVSNTGDLDLDRYTREAANLARTNYRNPRGNKEE